LVWFLLSPAFVDSPPPFVAELVLASAGVEVTDAEAAQPDGDVSWVVVRFVVVVASNGRWDVTMEMASQELSDKCASIFDEWWAAAGEETRAKASRCVAEILLAARMCAMVTSREYISHMIAACVEEAAENVRRVVPTQPITFFPLARALVDASRFVEAFGDCSPGRFRGASTENPWAALKSLGARSDPAEFMQLLQSRSGAARESALLCIHSLQSRGLMHEEELRSRLDSMTSDLFSPT